jgi:hypothetical protein
VKTGDTDTKHELLRQKKERKTTEKKGEFNRKLQKEAREQNTKKSEKLGEKKMARVDSTFAKLASS